MAMVEVLGVMVKLVAVAVVHTVPVPLNVPLPAPMIMARILLGAVEKSAAVTLLPLAFKVPWVRVKVLVAVRFAPNVTVIPEPLTVTS